MFLLRNHDDRAGLITLSDCAGRFESGNSASQDKIILIRIFLIPCPGFPCRDKVFRTYAADRTFLDGGVEDRAAYKALDKCSGALRSLLLLFLFEKDTSEVIAEIIGIRQLIGIGFKADPEAVQNTETDLFESLDNMRHALSGPSVASECGGQSSLKYRRIHTQGQVVYRLQSLAQDRGRTEQIAVSGCHIGRQICLVIEDEVIAVNFRSRIGDALRDFLGQLFCIAVGTDIRHHDQLLFLLYRRLAPFTIPAEDLIEVRIQDRSVTAADVLDLQILYAFQGIVHIRICKGSDDAVEVIFCCFRVAGLVCHA